MNLPEATGVAPPDQDSAESALRAWADALLRRDVAALAQLVAGELVYVHSTGIVHDRNGYIDFVRNGPTFLSVEMRDMRVRSRSGVAVVTGTLHLTLLRQDSLAPSTVTACATQAWFHEQGAWRLVAAQTTKPS